MTDSRYINCGPSDSVTAPGDMYGYLRLRIERPDLLYFSELNKFVWAGRDMRADALQFSRDIADKANDLVAPVESEPGAQPDSQFALVDLRSYASGATITVAELLARLDPVAKNLGLVIATVERIGEGDANGEARDAALASADQTLQQPAGPLGEAANAGKWIALALVALVAVVAVAETKKLVS